MSSNVVYLFGAALWYRMAEGEEEVGQEQPQVNLLAITYKTAFEARAINVASSFFRRNVNSRDYVSENEKKRRP